MNYEIDNEFRAGEKIWVMYGSVPRRARIETIEIAYKEKVIDYGMNKEHQRTETKCEVKYWVSIGEVCFYATPDTMAKTFHELRDKVFKEGISEYEEFEEL